MALIIMIIASNPSNLSAKKLTPRREVHKKRIDDKSPRASEMRLLYTERDNR